MIEMYERDAVFIAPDLDISTLLNKGYSDEEIEIEILKIDDEKPNNQEVQTVGFQSRIYRGFA